MNKPKAITDILTQLSVGKPTHKIGKKYAHLDFKSNANSNNFPNEIKN